MYFAAEIVKLSKIAINNAAIFFFVTYTTARFIIIMISLYVVIYKYYMISLPRRREQYCYNVIHCATFVAFLSDDCIRLIIPINTPPVRYLPARTDGIFAVHYCTYRSDSVYDSRAAGRLVDALVSVMNFHRHRIDTWT